MEDISAKFNEFKAAGENVIDECEKKIIPSFAAGAGGALGGYLVGYIISEFMAIPTEECAKIFAIWSGVHLTFINLENHLIKNESRRYLFRTIRTIAMNLIGSYRLFPILGDKIMIYMIAIQVIEVSHYLKMAYLRKRMNLQITA